MQDPTVNPRDLSNVGPPSRSIIRREARNSRVLDALCRLANDGRVSISLKNLAGESGFSPNNTATIKSALGDLEVQGVVRWVRGTSVREGAQPSSFILR